jgi:RimJ/RimL family protein N-acetyltransferase
MIPYATLSDAKISLRPFRFEDAGDLYLAVRESLAELGPWMSWAHDRYSQTEARDFITITRSRWEAGILYGFAITEASTGALLGGLSLSNFHPVYQFCNLGYWVRTGRRGQGIAGRAVQLAARFAFERLKLVRLEVVVAMGNEASLRVAEKIGAHREGILRNRIVVNQAVYDAVMFSFIPRDLDGPARL